MSFFPPQIYLSIYSFSLLPPAPSGPTVHAQTQQAFMFRDAHHNSPGLFSNISSHKLVTGGAREEEKQPGLKMNQLSSFHSFKSFRSSLTILMFFLMLLRKGPVLHVTGIAQHFSLNCPINNGRPSFSESVF